MRDVTLRYGKGKITLRLPAGADVLAGGHIPALADPEGACRRALREPIGGEPLRAIASRKKPRRVTITISDITRPVPNELVVGTILEELNAVGVGDDAVTVLIATGMHRPSTDEERRIMLGDALLRRVRVIDHQADAAADMVRVSDDPPVGVNRHYVDADLKIVTGLIEPHFMAGFSGGRKGVCPGLVDLATVQRFHGFAVMGDPRSVEGRLDGNPCHEEAMRVCRTVGVDFLVNVAIAHDRRPAGIYAGDWIEAHLAGCRQVARWNTAEVGEPYDLVVTSAGGYPLDANFYQTVKGMVTALPALAEGSTLLIASACGEVGSPEYTELMARFGGVSHRRFLRHIETSGRTGKDQWQYQMHTRVLERIGVERLRLVGDGLPAETMRKLAVNPVVGAPGSVAAQRMQRFVDDFAAENPGARIAVIPEGPYTMLALREPVAV